MIDCNVNNSISHPPHPRRAVPANLPPGAFFFTLMGLLPKVFILAYLLLTSSLSGIGGTDSDLSEKISELRLKSSAHGRYVSVLLSNRLQVENFLPPESLLEDNVINEDIILDLPTVDLPEPDETADLGLNTFTDSSDQVVAVPDSEEPNHFSSAKMDSQLIDSPQAYTYEELYTPKVPQRRVGYYFGPFLGCVFPDDSAVRDAIGSKISYDSQSGVTGGLRIGNDFGSARIEGEYAYLTHKIKSISGNGSGRSSFHNLQSRLILEKSLGGRADIRGGIGLGLGFVNKELNGKDYDGVGFSYDFLLGWSFRVMNNWSINMDYRHYLTAAHENYDRFQGHVVELSAAFDL